MNPLTKWVGGTELLDTSSLINDTYGMTDEHDEPEQEQAVQHHKYFEGQHDDEEVRYVFRHHPVVMRKGLLLASLGLLAGVIPAAAKPDLGMGWFFGGLGIGFVAGIILMIPSWVRWYFSVYIVTDQRFIQVKQSGFFRRSVVDLGLDKIQSVTYEIAGVQETLLGFGTILIQTIVGNLAIEQVHHPAEVHEKIIKIIKEEGIVPVTVG